MEQEIDMARAIETAKALLAVILIVAAFLFAGTLDHAEEVRHERWLAETEARGGLVLR